MAYLDNVLPAKLAQAGSGSSIWAYTTTDAAITSSGSSAGRDAFITNAAALGMKSGDIVFISNLVDVPVNSGVADNDSITGKHCTATVVRTVSYLDADGKAVMVPVTSDAFSEHTAS